MERDYTSNSGPCVFSPSGTPCFEFPPPNTKAHFVFELKYFTNKRTSRERPKSAPYLRLKNSKSTSKCQVLSSTVPKKISKNFLNFFEVSGKLHCTEKCKRGPLAVFQHPFFCKIGKNEGWTLRRH